MPDFLQLVASNIRAGMLIDKALWYAVRPRFGILAREIEIVAKETIVGKDIKLALTQFGERYDSIVLKRTISLIMEGMDAGGNLGELINKIAVDIEEAKVLQREMSANVSNYVIFIGFASIVAAPMLFALGHQFLGVVQKLALNTDIPKGVGPLASISLSGTGISSGSFTIFAFTSLTITAFFSALIVGVIKKGDAKSSVKYIPIFIIVALVIFYVVDKGLSSALANFF
ncbi:MAG: type II secretion system F family protein [Nanoarchaeota archaeon]